MSAAPLSLDSEKLKALELFAGRLFSLEELEVLMELPKGSLLSESADPDSVIMRTINRGRLIQKGKLRASILLSAEQGSSPAQTMSMQLLKEMEGKDA